MDEPELKFPFARCADGKTRHVTVISGPEDGPFTKAEQEARRAEEQQRRERQVAANRNFETMRQIEGMAILMATPAERARAKQAHSIAQAALGPEGSRLIRSRKAPDGELLIVWAMRSDENLYNLKSVLLEIKRPTRRI